MKIFKYELGFGSTNNFVDIEIHRGASVVSVNTDPQSRRLAVWAIVNEDEPKAIRRFRIVCTGFEIGNRADVPFVGTVLDPPFVWHVFDMGEL